MALHNLVSLKNELQNILNVDAVVKELTELTIQINNAKSRVSELSPDQETYINGLIKQYQHILDQVNHSLDSLPNELEKINQNINNITHQLFAGNYELEEHRGSVEYDREHKKFPVNEDIEQMIINRILVNTSWRYPALEIGCRDGEWTKYLVAADPLYITDRHPEFVDSTVGGFPESYQKRLRQYPLVNHDLSRFPTNQFGFIFSWGYFNFVSLDTMKLYLRQIFGLLRPGGIFMFTYNDGDTPAGAAFAESFSQTYMPQSLLIPLCESLGYEIYQKGPVGNPSWIEIKKPGTLHTVKAHQVLGEIKRQ